MAAMLKTNERLVRIGETALRAPDGTPLPTVPMYIIVDEKAVDTKTGLTKGEAELSHDIASLLAPKFKEYMDGVKRKKINSRGARND